MSDDPISRESNGLSEAFFADARNADADLVTCEPETAGQKAVRPGQLVSADTGTCGYAEPAAAHASGSYTFTPGMPCPYVIESQPISSFDVLDTGTQDDQIDPAVVAAMRKHIGESFLTPQGFADEINRLSGAQIAMATEGLPADALEGGARFEAAGHVWLIHFDDPDVPSETFTGDGAEAAAKARFESLSENWSVTLLRSADRSDPAGACECAARKALENLREYVAVEGRPEGDKVLVGLAYKSHSWGPCADPTYEMYELAEAVEKWLREKVDAALSTPCPCEGLRHELESERERADSNFASCERIKRKFEEATAERDRAKYEAAARLEQTLTQVEMHTRNTKEWRVALDAAEAERDQFRLDAEKHLRCNAEQVRIIEHLRAELAECREKHGKGGL